MNTMDENVAREQLERAVEVLDPVGPPFGQILARADKRRRNFRIGGGVAAVALVGAAVAVIVTVIPSSPAKTGTVQVSARPTTQSLQDYATAHGALKLSNVVGPYTTDAGSYGAFTIAHGIAVVRYGADGWAADGPAVTKLGKGRFVMRLGRGPQVGLTGDAPSFYVRTIGGDVSYFGAVLRDTTNGWRPANFGACGHHKLCYTPSNSEPYGRVISATEFQSVNNDCTPYCAAGTQYTVSWTWNPTKHEFIASSETAAKG